MICKYCPPLSRLPFHSLDGLLCYTEAFPFCGGLLVYFLFCFRCQTQKIIAKTNVKNFTSHVFFLDFYNFLCYVQVFNPFWVNFCIWHKIVVQFHSFACGCPIFPSPFIEETPFPVVYSWFLCHKSIDHICMCLFLGSLFCSINLCVCFYASTTLFQLLELCNIVWNQVVWYLQFFSLSKLLWLIGVFYDSLQTWGLFVLSLWKRPLQFWQNCIVSIDSFKHYEHFNNILPTHEDRVSFNLCVLQFLSLTSCYFQYTAISYPCLNSFLSILFFLMQLLMALFS